MSLKKEVRWLYGELPSLVSLGVLNPETAERLRGHYGPEGKGRGASIAIIVFGVLGAALIGLGIISLLASNWDGLSRPVRTVISFTPLMLSQALGGWVILRHGTSTAWREGTAVFLTLNIGLTIALISQTYNIAGDLGNFLLTWTLLALPVAYLLGSSASAVMYLAGITGWAVDSQVNDGQTLLFWALAAGIAPFVFFTVRNDRYGMRAVLVGWGVALCLCVSTGVVLEKNLPGLWTMVYMSLFALMYLVGSYWFADAATNWQRPFHYVGMMGTAITALILSFEWSWDHIGWRHYRRGMGYHEFASVADYIFLGTLVSAVVALVVVSVRRGRADVIPVCLGPAIAIGSFALSVGMETGFPGAVLFNLYVLGASVWVMSMGIRLNRLTVLNGGMLWFCSLIVLRFFDSDLGFIARGVVFIVVGVGFLATNMILISRRRQEA